MVLRTNWPTPSASTRNTRGLAGSLASGMDWPSLVADSGFQLPNTASSLGWISASVVSPTMIRVASLGFSQAFW